MPDVKSESLGLTDSVIRASKNSNTPAFTSEPIDALENSNLYRSNPSRHRRARFGKRKHVALEPDGLETGWTPGPATQMVGFQWFLLSASPATTTPKSSSHSTPFQGLELRKAEECPIRTDRSPHAPDKTIGRP